MSFGGGGGRYLTQEKRGEPIIASQLSAPELVVLTRVTLFGPCPKGPPDRQRVVPSPSGASRLPCRPLHLRAASLYALRLKAPGYDDPPIHSPDQAQPGEISPAGPHRERAEGCRC